MKRCFLMVVGLGLLLGAGLRVQAQQLDGIPLEVRATDQTKKLEHTLLKNDPKFGVGYNDDLQNIYTAELRDTTSGESVGGIKLRIISFFVLYDQSANPIGFQAGKVQVRDNITLAPGESRRVEFDPENYTHGQSKKVGSSVITLYMLGNEYTGVALEIYVNGILKARRFNGGKTKKAYDEWFDKNGEDKTPPAPAPAQASGGNSAPAPASADPAAAGSTPATTVVPTTPNP